ncbi:outer membrane lipoprotein-sorting protein [Thiolapillus sp.]|uniref:outer membrane lipoprotein-sorting protein n=1 Tax=Thiolapillus sp. TaxID=2017437 RepID=UPI0025FE2E15|nr:outer membrane lipoprotein-sorting protein [Thiolapillus sp.]
MNGLQIAEQVYAVSHGLLVRNAVSRQHGKDVAMVVNRAPLERRKGGRRPIVNTFETYDNSHPQNPALDSMQMAIIKSGKAKGTGILFVSYSDPSKPGIMSIWLPALRKIRRINEPSYEDTWVGTNLTYGELVLRKPEDEVHELLKEDVFQDCLPVMKLGPREVNRYTRKLPASQCGHKGRAVYVVKSTTRFENWWYDYHISEIDKETFAIYRTVYFKDGKKIKTISIDWQSLEQEDPRIQYPRYIYAITHDNGIDSMVYVPRSTVELNQDLPDAFWSEATLKKFGKR